MGRAVFALGMVALVGGCDRTAPAPPPPPPAPAASNAATPEEDAPIGELELLDAACEQGDGEACYLAARQHAAAKPPNPQAAWRRFQEGCAEKHAACCQALELRDRLVAERRLKGETVFVGTLSANGQESYGISCRVEGAAGNTRAAFPLMGAVSAQRAAMDACSSAAVVEVDLQFSLREGAFASVEARRGKVRDACVEAALRGKPAPKGDASCRASVFVGSASAPGAGVGATAASVSATAAPAPPPPPP